MFKAILISEGKKRVSGVNAAHEVARQHILKAFALGAEGLAGRVNAFLKPGHVLAHGLRLAGRDDSGKAVSSSITQANIPGFAHNESREPHA